MIPNSSDRFFDDRIGQFEESSWVRLVRPLKLFKFCSLKDLALFQRLNFYC